MTGSLSANSASVVAGSLNLVQVSPSVLVAYPMSPRMPEPGPWPSYQRPYPPAVGWTPATAAVWLSQVSGSPGARTVSASSVHGPSGLSALARAIAYDQPTMSIGRGVEVPSNKPEGNCQPEEHCAHRRRYSQMMLQRIPDAPALTVSKVKLGQSATARTE